LSGEIARLCIGYEEWTIQAHAFSGVVECRLRSGFVAGFFFAPVAEQIAPRQTALKSSVLFAAEYDMAKNTMEVEF
jgi:hypothetical protein